MCGIFAYIGSRQAAELLVAALKRLEYRGYDSAGVSIYGSPLKVAKKVGKVACLEQECNANAVALQGTVGIAHTRWATHGPPSDANSHPHCTATKSIAVVHNGIIENNGELRKALTAKGYIFTSDTDTEVLAHLVEDVRTTMPGAPWSQVVACALKVVEGAYGVVFMFQDDPDLLVGARKGSPLILGVGDGENMLASDGSAVVEHTRDVVYVRDGELVVVRRDSYQIYLASEHALCGDPSLTPGGSRLVTNPISRLEMSLGEIEKAGYPHFMLKEIMDQPNALRNAMRGRVIKKDELWEIRLGGLEKLAGGGEASDDEVNEPNSARIPRKVTLAPSATVPAAVFDLPSEEQTVMERLCNAKRIIVAACGTSWHSGLIAKFTIEMLAGTPVEVEYASEFRYRRPILCRGDVLVAISQSGETADTLEAIRIGKEFDALTIGIVNGVGSSIARLTDAGVYLHIGPEIGVASTKAFTGQVIAVLMIALKMARQRNTLSVEEVSQHCEALNAVPDLIKDWLEPLNKQIKAIAKYFRLATNVLFCGCGIHFPVALEGALKLKEISYIHAEGFTAAEIKHGPLALVRGFLPVIAVAMRSDPGYDQILANLEELHAKDASLVVITDDGNSDFSNIANFVIHCPPTKMIFEPLMVVVPLQLLSYHIADMRGCSIDQPRNLAKSVTVE